MYSKSIPIARFSFWNLVGLGESQSDLKGEGKQCDLKNEENDNDNINDVEENDGQDEEPETYKRLCYL